MDRRIDSISRPALMLVIGRGIGFAASFAIPVVLSRLFDRSEFGTYKQLFLIYGTLYGLAQLGVAESLYYFVPRKAEDAGRHIANSLLTLALVGAGCLALVALLRGHIAGWFTNPQIAREGLLLGLFLALMLASALFEIVLVSRKRHLEAAATYAGSDLLRTLLFVAPALAFDSVHGVLLGAACFAAVRLLWMIACLWHDFGRQLRIDLTLWRHQLAYALPFALAVGIEVVQTNFHQYVVASRFDAATFAIYAVGCLQIPLVDLLATSTANVMMVRMAEDSSRHQTCLALDLWHHAICRLALLIFPLAVFLILTSREVIVALFTARYLASVPIFMAWALTIVPATFCVDAVLRVYAQTRFLLITNLFRLLFVAAFIGPFLSAFGLLGAVLVTLAATCSVRVLGIVRIAQLMHVRMADVLPWGQLAGLALRSVIAGVPGYYLGHQITLPPLLTILYIGGLYAATYALLCRRWIRGEPRAATASVPIAVATRPTTLRIEES
ncbi:MAG: lipopolysaccharide biosynthesis protein [Acidobacteria bacterium]|nr:lipopolysaccharide biosynthesis protein [Acidobacteriota bacterium]